MERKISQSSIAVWEKTKNGFFDTQILNAIDQLLEANEKIKALEEELEVERSRFRALEEKINT